MKSKMDNNYLVPLAVPLAGGLPPLGLSTGGLAFLSLPLEFPTDGLDPFICSLELLFILQCVTIENRQSPFYVVNRVTLTGKKLY